PQRTPPPLPTRRSSDLSPGSAGRARPRVSSRSSSRYRSIQSSRSSWVMVCLLLFLMRHKPRAGGPAELCRSLQVVLLGRIAGEVGDHRVSVLQIEHLEDGVRRLAVLALDDGVLDA